MKKRDFLAATLATMSLPGLASARPANLRSPALLTVTGAIGSGNRGALDPALDQLLKKQGVKFDRAHVFDWAAITALRGITIQPTLEYDARPHRLRGPLLTDVIKAAGANPGDNAKVVLRAIDGYAVSVSVADARRLRFLVATHLDGLPMPLGGLGPLWAVYDADRVPELASKPLNERFGLCPWGLHHIEVQ